MNSTEARTDFDRKMAAANELIGTEARQAAKLLAYTEYTSVIVHGMELRQLQENILARDERNAIAAQLRDVKLHLVEKDARIDTLVEQIATLKEQLIDIQRMVFQIREAQPVAERSTGATTP